MTSPRHAEATSKGRYYTHPATGQSLVSVTNVLSVGCAKPALVPWAAKIAAEHAIDHLPQLVVRSRTDRDGAVKDIKDQVTVARDKAADLGTRIHARAEAHLTGQQLPPDPEVDPYQAQYERFLADFGVDLRRDVEAAELTVANPAAGWAGTLDIMLRLALDGYVPGQQVRPLTDDQPRALWLIDIKSSATRPSTSIYPEYALQLAALRNAREAWLPDDTVTTMPRGIVGAAVLNLRPKSYAFIPVPTGPAEYDAFKGSLALTKWMHAQQISDCRPIDPAGEARPKRGASKKTNSRKVA